MARITVEDCLDHVDNRFELVLTGTKRARQIAVGGKDPMVEEEKDKPTVLALREIAEGLVTPEVLAQDDEDQFEEMVDDIAAIEASIEAAQADTVGESDIEITPAAINSEVDTDE